MNKKILILLLIFFGLPFKAVAIPTIEHWETSDQTPIYFIQSNSVPMVEIKLLFNAGSAYDGASFGLAALTNAFFAEGAGNLTAQAIAENFDEIGAQFDVEVDKSTASINLLTLTDPVNLSSALSLFNIVVSQLNFSESTFTRIKNQQLVAIKDREQQPNIIAKENFYQQLYNNTPYAHPVLGIEDSINAITKQQVMQFYQHFYTARNASILIVGDISATQAKTIAEEVIKGLPVGERQALTIKAKPLTQGKLINIHFPANQTYWWLGNLSVDNLSSDSFALIVANQIIGGSGLTSLLAESVREQHSLTYDISSELVPVFGLQPFIIVLQSKNNTAAQAVLLTKKILANFITEGPTSLQLEQAKKFLIGNFYISFASNRELMASLTFLVKYHYTLNYLSTYAQNINDVSIKHVRQVLEQYLNPEIFLLVSVGNPDLVTNNKKASSTLLPIPTVINELNNQ